MSGGVAAGRKDPKPRAENWGGLSRDVHQFWTRQSSPRVTPDSLQCQSRIL